MTTQQKTIEYQGGRLTRLKNLPITQLVGGMIMMKYRNCPCHLSPQILAYLDGWHDQDVELSLEVS